MRELFAPRIAGVAIASLVFASSLIAAARAQSNKVGTNLDPQNFGQIERGRYLAVAGDCASCHTVPGSNQPFAGGRPIGARCDRGEGAGTARLRHDPQGAPQRLLRLGVRLGRQDNWQDAVLEAVAVENLAKARRNDAADAVKALGTGWAGAAPYTVLIGTKGEVLYRTQGEMNVLDVRRAILKNVSDDLYLGQHAYWNSVF